MALTSIRKFLAVIAGIDTLIPAAIVGGTNNAYEIGALGPNGTFDVSMMPSGFGVDAENKPATEAIAAGALVNVWLSGSTPSIRNADNTSAGKPAVGFCPAAIASGASGTVYYSGIITGLTGLTVGSEYYLGTVGGVVLGSSLPTNTGTIIQSIGIALTTTTLQFNPQPQINQ
jgi:hypothetical protein